MKSKFQLIGYTLYVLIAVVTSAPLFVKRSAYFFVFLGLYGLVLVAVIYVTQRFDLQKIAILSHPAAWIFLVLVLAVLNLVIYPQTRLTPGTAPNALMEPAVAMLRNGANPYSVRLFDGAGISPGPGWILLNALFSLTGLITLLTPLYLFWAATMLAKWSKLAAFLFVALLLLTLSFVQMSSIGHDLPATSLALLALALMLHRYHENRPLFWLTAMLTGLLATARVPFIIMPVALSLCLSVVNRRRALQFALLSVGLALIVHLGFYLWAVHDGIFYQPLHVFGRAKAGSSMLVLGLGGLIWLGAAWFTFRKVTHQPASWLIFLWVSVAIPFITVGVGELLSKGIFSLTVWANWEGKGYTVFTIPLLLAALALYKVKVPRTYIKLM